jgi:hypothetical protein
LEENRNSLPGEQQTAGISCAVLRGNDLFIAQAGPAAVYLTHEDQLVRYPDRSPWLDDVRSEELNVAPLGTRRDVHINLFHTPVSRGDVVLLLDHELVPAISLEAWADILAGPSVRAVLDNLIAAARGVDLSALVIMLGKESAREISAPPAEPGGVRQTAEPSAPKRAVDWFERIQVGKRLRTTGQALSAAGLGLIGVLLTLLKRIVPSQYDTQQASRRKSATVKKHRKERGELAQRLLIATAVAIPLVVAVIVLVVVIQRGQAQRAELDALWEKANLSWQQARTASDQANARTHLAEAQASLAQLLKRQPDHAGAAELLPQIEARLDEINQVKRVNWVGQLHTYPADANLTRVVVEGAHVFVLDRNDGKVYHHQLDEFQQALKPETVEKVLVSRGDQVGSVLVADLVDMTWMPTGHGRQKAALVIFESGGTLLEYDPTTAELIPLRVAASETWQFPRLVGSHSGRFYLLDPSANEIWRYAPTPNDYSTPPDEWLQSEVDLLGVKDMAIGNSIYLLYADGKIRKLTAGSPDAFDISDWDTLPRNASAIFTRPPEDTQWLYVADQGNSRIVQCSKEGRFKQQFRLADTEATGGTDALANVTSLFVDEISGHAFFLSGRQLYMIILPD